MPSSPPEGPRLERLLPLLCWCVFCSVLNGTMFNVAVPDIARDFLLTAADVSWVITGYIVIFAIGSISYGKLADSSPVRRLLTTGLLLFNAGALLSLVANSYPLLVAGRLLQASGGAAIPALVMIIATRFAPAEKRGRVLGAVGATVAFAMGLGPLVGGLLAGELHWRWLFALSFATLPAVPLLALSLPQEQTRPLHFDLSGACWLTLLVASLLTGMTSARPLFLGIAFLFALGLFRRQKRAEHPFIPLRLLRDGSYRRALLVTFLAMGTVFGLLFAIPLLLRQVHNVSTSAIGLLIFPGAFSASLTGLLGGRLTDRRGATPVALLGLSTLACGQLLMGLVAGIGPAAVLLLLIPCYIGFSLLQPALGKTVSLLLPAGQSGIGMGLYNLVYFISGAFGTALAGSMLTSFGPGASWMGGPALAPYGALQFLLALACILAALVFWFSFRDRKF